VSDVVDGVTVVYSVSVTIMVLCEEVGGWTSLTLECWVVGDGVGVLVVAVLSMLLVEDVRAALELLVGIDVWF
jgi:hypothetical protein